MPQFPNIALSILAGGKSSRMGGRNKALLEIDGQTFISRIYSRLSPLFGETIIISNEINDFNLPNVNFYADVIENAGPLGGIHSAMVNSSRPCVFIVSCDMPFADPKIASVLSNLFITLKSEILVPTINTYKEPLFAVYSRDLQSKIESIIAHAEGRPISDLFNVANTNYFNLPLSAAVKNCFTNINTIEDYNRLILEQY
jgi:molybdopterin-guanine dinucleotide biosynthesis protein A